MSIRATHRFEESAWTVYWQPPTSFSAGVRNPNPPRPGIVLKSDKGERQFLPMPDEMQPSQHDLENIDKFIGWLKQARGTK